MKKLPKIVLFILIVLLLSGCTNKELTSKEKEALKFKEEYESLNGKSTNNRKYRKVEIEKDNPMRYKSASDIVKMIEEKKTFIVYFGFDSCPWCRSVVPTLLEVAKDLEVDTIYYVDVKEIRDVLKLGENEEVITEKKGEESYYKLLELLDSVLDQYLLTNEDKKEIDTGEKRIYAPSVVSVVDGVAVELESGISEEQTDAYMKLTEKMKQDTYHKFKCSIQCVLESSTTCSNKNSC